MERGGTSRFLGVFLAQGAEQKGIPYKTRLRIKIRVAPAKGNSRRKGECLCQRPFGTDMTEGAG